VIQFVVARALPGKQSLRARCLADPDVLLSITSQVNGSSESTTQLCDDFSAILHDLRIGGVWKRTGRSRLKQTQEMLCAHIPPDLRQEPAFLDVGASDGITTVEAVRALRRAFGGEVRALLTDLHLWLYRYRRGPIFEYRAADGEPVMARFGRLGIRLARHRQGVENARNGLADLYLRNDRFRKSMRLDARIPLVNPIARIEPGIAIMELDCLVRENRLNASMAAVRASNVLNLGYFSACQLHTAIGNLHAYLRNRGCLVVSRKHDRRAEESENGSVWVKDGHRFQWVQDFGSGAEIKGIVDSWSLS
jgi:hypothetical protein